MPVAVPQGVDVAIKDDQISVKGTGGTLSLALNALVKVTNEGGKLTLRAGQRVARSQCHERHHAPAGEQHGRSA